VPNSNYALKAGVTATVRISSGKTLAQQVPGRILTLDDSGNVGIRYIDRNNIVRFTEVSTIDEDANDFVSVGMEVDVSEAGAASVNQVAGEPAISQ